MNVSDNDRSSHFDERQHHELPFLAIRHAMTRSRDIHYGFSVLGLRTVLRGYRAKERAVVSVTLGDDPHPVCVVGGPTIGDMRLVPIEIAPHTAVHVTVHFVDEALPSSPRLWPAWTVHRAAAWWSDRKAAPYAHVTLYGLANEVQ